MTPKNEDEPLSYIDWLRVLAATDNECGCQHDDENCCNLVNEPCARCLAREQLQLIDGPEPSSPSVEAQERRVYKYCSDPIGHDDPNCQCAEMLSSRPLTYEQEVHALLHAAASNTESLLGYFEAQAIKESGDAKKLTLKCIEWKRDDLRRIRELIPQALQKREAALAPTQPQPRVQTEAARELEEWKQSAIKQQERAEAAEQQLAEARAHLFEFHHCNCDFAETERKEKS